MSNRTTGFAILNTAHSAAAQEACCVLTDMLSKHDSAPYQLVNLCKEQHSELRVKLVQTIDSYSEFVKKGLEAQDFLDNNSLGGKN